MDVPGSIHQVHERGSASSTQPVSVDQTEHISVNQYSSTNSAFSSSAYPDEDDETEVLDPAERRRLQNRIAQRNYREKIKERMAKFERKRGSDGNDNSMKFPKTSKKQQRRQSSPPPPGHQSLQPPSQWSMPQYPFTINSQESYCPSPSPLVSGPRPFVSYQPNSPPKSPWEQVAAQAPPLPHSFSSPLIANTYPAAYVAHPQIQPTSSLPASSTSPYTSFSQACTSTAPYPPFQSLSQVPSQEEVVTSFGKPLAHNDESPSQSSFRSFFSEATKFLKATIRSAETSEHMALEGQRLLPILSEMQSCIQRSEGQLLFSVNPSEIRLPALNRAKLAIEASTGAEWEWWPLQPPRHPACTDRVELSWQCSCGMKRRESTLPYYGNQMKYLFDNFPLSPSDGSGPISRLPDSSSKAGSQGSGNKQSMSSSSENFSGGQSTSSSSSSANASITPPESVVDFGTGSRRYIYVFLLTKASEYTLDTINVNSMKSRDLFQRLRAIYHKRRGFWRRAFSVFVYNHCDFIKILKPEPDTFMPGELKFELPANHDDEYHYRPRPSYSAPISKHMFRHYFYGCYDSSALSHRLHNYLPLAPTCRIRNPAAELLDYLPKRDRKLEAAAHSDKVEICYGLAARECRSFFRVVVYLCLIMTPAFWFLFVWLFAWGDRGDLQDATVPMTLTLAVLTILWAVVYSGSDVRKDYGDT